MARKTPQLNLAPEKRQVLSSDFNLFYKPQAKPEIAGAKELYSSLNNFVNDAGKKMVIASEICRNESFRKSWPKCFSKVLWKWN